MKDYVTARQRIEIIEGIESTSTLKGGIYILGSLIVCLGLISTDYLRSLL